MNQGLYTTFSQYSPFDPNNRNIITFDQNGAYCIESDVKLLFIMAVGAGGGGGGGSKFASGSAAGGGAAGAPGSIVRGYFLTEDFGGPNSVLNITIGAGGTGGAGSASDGNNGNIGISGGATIIDVNGSGTLLTAPGGPAGSGGTTGGNNNGGLPIGFLNYGIFNVMPRAANSGNASTGTAGGSVTVQNFISSFGGGGGGGKTSAGVILAGGSISAFTTSDSGVFNPNITLGSTLLAGGSTDGQSGASNINLQPFGLFSPGLGGAGGAGGVTVNAGNGGNGWRGGGGGGGGGGTNGLNAGTGGTGGNGFVAIFAIRGQ